jgi:hypothetical protein
MWLGYAAFHNGDYRLAIESYEEHIAKYAALGESAIKSEYRKKLYWNLVDQKLWVFWTKKRSLLEHCGFERTSTYLSVKRVIIFPEKVVKNGRFSMYKKLPTRFTEMYVGISKIAKKWNSCILRQKKWRQFFNQNRAMKSSTSKEK